MSDDGARADEAALAQSHTANDRGVRAHRDSFFDPRFHRNPGRVAATRSEIVGQHGVWAKEDVIGNVYMLPHGHAVLDRHVVADRHAALDKSVIPDVAMRSYSRVLQHVRERPDARTLANRISLDQRFLVDKCCCHAGT